MKNFVVFLLIALLTGFGPVTGGHAHAHEIDSFHDHETGEHSTISTADHIDQKPHHENDDTIHDDAEHGLDYAAFVINPFAPTDTDGQVFHVHIATDGAPSGTGEIRFLAAFATVPRSLTNSDPVIGSAPAVLQRPPKQIL
ncbi:MAG: hypothetical protein DHS20C06_03750 [Hyphobacterium sp.]|nr:MAG: hypothetical protein DHS20C06_03750 [Hyphobacterium sp.]